MTDTDTARATQDGYRPVLITTEYRGVFAGLIPADQDLTARSMPLKAARMMIYWGTRKHPMPPFRDQFRQVYRAMRFLPDVQAAAREMAALQNLPQPVWEAAVAAWSRRHDWKGGGIAYAKGAPDFRTAVDLYLRAARFRRATDWLATNVARLPDRRAA